jgi:hypothetical protein
MDGYSEIQFDDFSDMVLDLDGDLATRYIKPPRVREISEQALKYRNAEKLAESLIITPNERYFVLVDGSFIFGDFIEALMVKNDFHAKQMIISTLSLNENNIDSLYNLISGGYVDDLSLIISDYFFSHERNNLVKYIYEQLDIENKFQLAVAGTHCKLCIIETHCGKYIVIDGSANLRSSGNLEQFRIEENKEVYQFNYDFQKAIIDKFKTINKSIRGNALWQLVANDSQE